MQPSYTQSRLQSLIQRVRLDSQSLSRADVMYLHKTIGNQAVGRLLSNSSAVSKHNNNFSSSQTRLPIQRIKIHKVSAKGGWGGRRDVKWAFELDQDASKDGWLVQGLKIYEDVKQCDEPRVNARPDKPTETYWEAWKIYAGDRKEYRHARFDEQEASQGRPPSRNVYTDNDTYPQKDECSGFSEVQGLIRFYYETDTGTDNPKNWKKNDRTGTLPSVKTEPSFWKKPSREPEADRFARSRWNSCSEHS